MPDDAKTIETTGLIHLVTPRQIRAEDVRECQEIKLSGGKIPNPFYIPGRSDSAEKEKDDPYTVMKRLIETRWKVLMIGYKRSDGPTNFNHDPTINLGLVAVLFR